VADRDLAFIEQHLNPETTNLTFGIDHQQVYDRLAWDNPDGDGWAYLQKAIALGCGNDDPGAKGDLWVCPPFQATGISSPVDGSVYEPFETVVIVGTDVNVRQAPDSGAAVVGTVSNEVVKLNPVVWEVPNPDLDLGDWETFEGWMAIVLPNGQSGYVSSRYAYSLLGYRAGFSFFEDQWQFTFFLAGD
jgi:hypothetical protein